MMTRALSTTFLLLTFALAQPARATDLVGEWVLNVERSAEVQPEQPEERQWFNGQNVNTSVSFGGLPLPKVRQKVPPMSSHTERQPGVLRCKEMTIANKGEDLLFTYVDIGSEVRKRGNKHGFKTSWGKRRLTESYKSTTRKVTHRFELQKDDSLLVTVTIKPDKGSKRVYKQVFDRKS